MFKQAALDILQKQYTYTNISDLVLQKAEVLDTAFGDLSETFVKEILDFDTCIPEALDYYWGKVFRISRTFTDDDNNEFTITYDQFRQLIKIKAFATRWDGSALQMNEFLRDLYKDRGVAYMIDRQNMSVQVYVFTFGLEPWERYLFTNKDVLPRPAGVQTDIYEVDIGSLFGFQGTEFQPFNQGVFWTGRVIY